MLIIDMCAVCVSQVIELKLPIYEGMAISVPQPRLTTVDARPIVREVVSIMEVCCILVFRMHANRL